MLLGKVTEWKIWWLKICRKIIESINYAPFEGETWRINFIAWNFLFKEKKHVEASIKSIMIIKTAIKSPKVNVFSLSFQSILGCDKKEINYHKNIKDKLTKSWWKQVLLCQIHSLGAKLILHKFSQSINMIKKDKQIIKKLLFYRRKKVFFCSVDVKCVYAAVLGYWENSFCRALHRWGWEFNFPEEVGISINFSNNFLIFISNWYLRNLE